jgi:TorA maturation chaperone TorD
LDQIVASGKQEGGQTGEVPLEDVWMNLVGAAKNSKALDWKVEYDNSFLGVGKPNVFLYGSFYMAGHLHEKPLLEIRRSLQQFGLEASDSISETEDHIAALFEVMRYLIAGSFSMTIFVLGSMICAMQLTQIKKFISISRFLP